MAAHRAEQIVAAVQALVTSLTTTGSRVDRGIGYEIDSALTPALRVRMGEDVIIEPWSANVIDSDLDVSIEAFVHDSTNNVETVLNLIRKEVNIALAANYTLGLAFVLAIVELGASQPRVSTDQDKPAASMELLYRVRYRRSRLDPSVDA